MSAGLNEAQRAAAHHHRGPLLVLAGAGSGKTRVITQRIARLVERGVPPARILALSFTNKAAAEMGERMVPLVGEERAGRLWLSTFHSFGVRFLQEENKALGFDGRFVIFDQGDQLGLLRELLAAERPGERDLDVPALLSRISLWKNAFLAPEEVRPSDYEYDVVAHALYPVYEERLRAMHAVDFDDLVCAPVRVLKEREDLRAKWRARFAHLLVDEFQDTNRSQLELVRALANDEQNVCVVGDDDQSIYGWRGAEVGNILDFERHFPGATVVKLETNYRSRASILAVANAAIAQSRGKRHGKVLRPARGDGPPVRVLAVPDAGEEAKFVVREIRELTKGGDASPGGRRFAFRDVAVLYRSNTQAKILEEELRVGGIPYRVYGGTQLFDRKEVKDLIAYLRVVAHRRDALSLRRVVNTPPRGVGLGSLERLRQHALAEHIDLETALRRADRIEGVSEPARRGLRSFLGAIDEARRALAGGAGITGVTRTLATRVGILETGPLADPKARRRRENVDFLLRSLERYEKRERNDVSLAAFLMRLTLRTEAEEKEAQNQVTLSSLHSAKGLEFDVVFLIGCVEGQLPHSRTTDPKATEAAPTDVDEERRLFYVGVTRAREVLYLSRPTRKLSRGRLVPRVPSRFLEGFPEGAWETYVHSGETAMSSDEIQDMAAQLLARLRG
ncbi:MAG: UvrD-helicase domain-containing protein [Myxococcota bacterium]